MAVTTLDRRVVINDADALTLWTGPDTLITTPRAEGTYSVGNEVSPSSGQTAFYYTPAAALDLDTDLLYVQSHTNAIQNGWKEATPSDSSHGMYLNDGTNELFLMEAGNDRDVFKHANSQVAFQSFLIDLDYLATKNTNGEVEAIAGSVASFVKTSVDDVGSVFHTESKALGGGQNCFVDIMRIDEVDTSGDSTTSTSGIFIYAGGSGTEGNFAEVTADDESVAADKGFGVIREYTAGSYGCQGRLKFGTTDVLSNAYFLDSNFSLTFEDRDVNDDKFGIWVFGNSTDTNDFDLSDGTIASAGPGVIIDMSSANIEVLQLNNVAFKDLLNTISFPTDTVTGSQDHDVINCTFQNCGTVTPGTVVFDDNTFLDSNATTNAVQITNDISALRTTVSGYEGTAGTAAMLWNVNADPNGNIDNSSFTMGTALTHAIEFGSSAPLTMTLTGCDFSGYSASDAVNNSTFLFADRGSDVTWTLNISGCTGNFTYRQARVGDTVNIVVDPVTTLINIKDPDGNNEQNVNVYMEAADGTGDLPYQQTINTITRSTTTATVTFAAAHGLEAGEYLKLDGITDKTEDNSGAFEVKTVPTSTTLTYDTTDSGSTSYTGTIVGTGATIYGTTDASGNISSSRTYLSAQPLTGYARKSDDGTTYFKNITIIDTVSTVNGLTINRRLVSDGLV